MELTSEVCDVSPFLNTYAPVKEIPVGRCCTVWTCNNTGREVLLVTDQMLWFGSQMEHSLINPNQIREYGLPVFDNPFDTDNYGIDDDDIFIPFATTGTVVYFESRSPTEWEEKHLPILLLTGDTWDPTDIQLGTRTREQAALRTVRTLQVAATGTTWYQGWGQVEEELSKISPILNGQTFGKRLICAINIATTQRTKAATITKDRHSKVGPEELARKWNIGLQTAKDTLEATTQHGVRTAVHPMTRRLRVDHLHLHRTYLRGMWYADTLMAKVKSRLGNTCANVFTQGKYTKVVPMTSRAEAGRSLVDFTDDVGIPEMLTTDGAGEFTGRNTNFVKEARRMRIKLHTTEQGRKNQNHAAEREIGILSKRWKLRMRKKRVPK